MKQEILCPKCTYQMKRMIGKGYPGEYTDFQEGRARRPFKCDFCGNDIAPLDRCVAFSLWSDTIPNYPGWWINYIITGGDK